MHIFEGLLSDTPQGNMVLLGGGVVAAVGTAVGLWKLDVERIPRVAMLSAAFFVVSSMPVPLGGVSVHLALVGLMGVMLGWSVFPALLVALYLQAVMLGHGGLTTLGVNMTTAGLAAVACHYLFRRGVGSSRTSVSAWMGAAAGAVGILICAGLVATVLLAAGGEYKGLTWVSVAAHLPLAGLEAMVTANTVLFIRKVRPELLAVGSASE